MLKHKILFRSVVGMAQEHDEHVKPKTISDLSHMDWNFKAGLKK